jgi:predicted nucleotidyltransferase
VSEVVVLNAPAPLDVPEIRRRLVPVLRRLGAVEAFVIGSFARGSADAWSDVDLVVVMPTDLVFVERARLLGDVFDALPVGVDMLVYTPEEFAAGRARDFGIFHTLAREGTRIL